MISRRDKKDYSVRSKTLHLVHRFVCRGRLHARQRQGNERDGDRDVGRTRVDAGPEPQPPRRDRLQKPAPHRRFVRNAEVVRRGGRGGGSWGSAYDWAVRYLALATDYDGTIATDVTAASAARISTTPDQDAHRRPIAQASIAERPSSPAAAAGETSNPDFTLCRRSRV